MRHMLRLEREARTKDQKTMDRQAKTIAMLTDHLERLMGGMRAYAEMKLHADAKVHALRHSCQRLRTVIDKQQLSISVHHQLIASLRDTGGMLERQLSDMDRRYDDLRGKLMHAKKQHAAAVAAAAAAAGDGAAKKPTTASESERPRSAPGGFKSSAAWPGASTSATTLGIVSPPPSPTPQQARQEARVKRRKDQQVATDVVPALPTDTAAPLVSLPPGLQDDAEEGARGDFYTGGRYSFSRPGTGTSPGADDAEEAKWLQLLVSTPPGEDGGDGDGDAARSAARPRQVGGEGEVGAEGSVDGGPFSAVKWYDAERARRDGASFQPAATGAARTHLPTDGDGNGDSDGVDGVIGSPESASASRRRLSKVVAHVSHHARLSLTHLSLPLLTQVFDMSALSPSAAADDTGMGGFSEQGLKKLVAKLVRLLMLRSRVITACLTVPWLTVQRKKQVDAGDPAAKWTSDRLADLVENKGRAYLQKIMAEQEP